MIAVLLFGALALHARPALATDSRSSMSPAAIVSDLVHMGIADKEIVNYNLDIYLKRADRFIAVAKSKDFTESAKKAELNGFIEQAQRSLEAQVRLELVPEGLRDRVERLAFPAKGLFSDAAALVAQGRFEEAIDKAAIVRRELKSCQAAVNSDYSQKKPL